jgi:carbon-monoxide dehydrogenase medium subunit
MILPRFDFEAPSSAAQAAALLAQAGPEAHVLAGGTDLLVKMKHGLLRPRLLVSLRRIASLARTEPAASGGLRLGALRTMSALSDDPALRDAAWCALAEGAASVGGPLIRNRATVGGNIVNARPCADTAPPLLALGAILHLTGPTGERSVPLDGFITGPGATTLGAAEILTAIEIPAPASRAGSCYLKITRRAAMEVTIAGCAASLALDDEGQVVVRARVVLTSVAPVPLRVPEVEQILEGRSPHEARFREAAAAAQRAARPIDDPRAPAEYRSDVVQAITRRALDTALARAMKRRCGP